ncbi:hypothetical protein C2S53_011788 [Perilla frutescens var. hirtella]|uniref:Uncharacterized protein n=1 Tax=Perilla frutescens var. hirtella TaxID=608512 RepID=A0AAD4P304_PERFH|nr:hypothetical protein C2S53_011788 [Perilla frutescens var. hirtella]
MGWGCCSRCGRGRKAGRWRFEPGIVIVRDESWVVIADAWEERRGAAGSDEASGERPKDGRLDSGIATGGRDKRGMEPWLWESGEAESDKLDVTGGWSPGEESSPVSGRQGGSGSRQPGGYQFGEHDAGTGSTVIDKMTLTKCQFGGGIGTVSPSQDQFQVLAGIDEDNGGSTDQGLHLATIESPSQTLEAKRNEE